jgi:peptidoglycan hydrolase CwlO-like protein
MTEAELTNARFWFDALQVVWAIAVPVYVWYTNRQRATKEAIARVEQKHDADVKRLEGRIQEYGNRVLMLEQQVMHLPNNDKIGEVHYRIDQVGQGLKGMEGQMKQMNSTLQIIQEYLLENKR